MGNLRMLIVHGIGFAYYIWTVDVFVDLEIFGTKTGVWFPHVGKVEEATGWRHDESFWLILLTFLVVEKLMGSWANGEPGDQGEEWNGYGVPQLANRNVGYLEWFSRFL